MEVRAEEREKKLVQSSSSGYYFQKEVHAGKIYGQNPRKLPSWNSSNCEESSFVQKLRETQDLKKT